MAIKSVLSVIASSSNKLSEILIENGQLIFLQDTNTIAFDWGNKRVFYNQIEDLENEEARANLANPVIGRYYFVIVPGILYRYGGNSWKQLTSTPESNGIVIDTKLPEVGTENQLYVNKSERNISIWDNSTQKYEVVGEKVGDLSAEDISNLFNI